MKTYYSNKEVKKDIVNGVLKVDDDIEISFDGFCIEADIICYNIYSKDYRRDIAAGNITANNILAWNILAGHISAWDILAGHISARDILAWDISAWDITAGNILYYAFCISYQDIKCKSIKGGRDNSFHKCLDGELIIDDNIESKSEQIRKIKEKAIAEIQAIKEAE